jgi:hypothetical protein
MVVASTFFFFNERAILVRLYQYVTGFIFIFHYFFWVVLYPVSSRFYLFFSTTMHVVTLEGHMGHERSLYTLMF